MNNYDLYDHTKVIGIVHASFVFYFVDGKHHCKCLKSMDRDRLSKQIDLALWGSYGGEWAQHWQMPR